MKEEIHILKEKTKSVGFSYLLLLLSWLWLSHFHAWIKCTNGIGVFFLINEKTKKDYNTWSIFNEHIWLMVFFSILILVCYGIMKRKGSVYRLRFFYLTLVSIVVFWYSGKCAYLGGKILRFVQEN